MGVTLNWHRLPGRPAAATVVALLALAGCTTGNTYGTGTTPAMQTLQDLTGIAAIGAAKNKEPIDYSPRAKIVAPPNTAALPPPKTDDPTQTASNWPQDPDLLKAQVKADAAAREAAGAQQLNLPKARAIDGGYQPGDKPLTKEEQEEVRRQIAAAKGAGMSFDANGNPTRKYLTDPPNDYRVADPNAPPPVADAKKKKKFKWWWQKDS